MSGLDLLGGDNFLAGEFLAGEEMIETRENIRITCIHYPSKQSAEVKCIFVPNS